MNRVDGLENLLTILFYVKYRLIKKYFIHLMIQDIRTAIELNKSIFDFIMNGGLFIQQIWPS